MADDRVPPERPQTPAPDHPRRRVVPRNISPTPRSMRRTRAGRNPYRLQTASPENESNESDVEEYSPPESKSQEERTHRSMVQISHSFFGRRYSDGSTGEAFRHIAPSERVSRRHKHLVPRSAGGSEDQRLYNLIPIPGVNGPDSDHLLYELKFRAENDAELTTQQKVLKFEQEFPGLYAAVENIAIQGTQVFVKVAAKDAVPIIIFNSMGKRVTLLTRSKLRYVGRLFRALHDNSVLLYDCTSFGTEGRENSPTEHIASDDNVHESIVIRVGDIEEVTPEEESTEEGSQTRRDLSDPARDATSPQTLDGAETTSHETTPTGPSQSDFSRRVSSNTTELIERLRAEHPDLARRANSQSTLNTTENRSLSEEPSVDVPSRESRLGGVMNGQQVAGSPAHQEERDPALNMLNRARSNMEAAFLDGNSSDNEDRDGFGQRAPSTPSSSFQSESAGVVLTDQSTPADIDDDDTLYDWASGENDGERSNEASLVGQEEEADNEEDLHNASSPQPQSERSTEAGGAQAEQEENDSSESNDARIVTTPPGEVNSQVNPALGEVYPTPPVEEVAPGVESSDTGLENVPDLVHGSSSSDADSEGSSISRRARSRRRGKKKGKRRSKSR